MVDVMESVNPGRSAVLPLSQEMVLLRQEVVRGQSKWQRLSTDA